ncbi:MAG: hypothetical protein ACRD43_13875, partial [Pyrinomonadaceae bacterium]
MGAVNAMQAAGPERDMRIPDESLEDFMTGMTVAPKPADPPPSLKPVRFSGKVELLKPAVPSEIAERALAVISPFVAPGPLTRTHRPSGFYRSLGVVGTVAIIALVLASSIFIGTYRSDVEPATTPSNVGLDQQPEGILTSPDEPDLSGPSTPASSPLVSDEPRAVRSVRKRSPVRVLRAGYRPRRAVRAHKIIVTNFVPTTLVIYPENGEIKTRIEPQ